MQKHCAAAGFGSRVWFINTFWKAAFPLLPG
jgi:hypothetical protein